MVQVIGRKKKAGSPSEAAPTALPEETHLVPGIPIPAGDPLEAYLLSTAEPVDLTKIQVVSLTVDELIGAGVELVVPLVGQSELIGALYLGPRLSEQPYSTDDRRLLAGLASQVAPAMRVAQLVQEQQAEAEERERVQQEMQVAAIIQQTLLPQELPSVPGWAVDAFYRPARAVGGDFYDFIPLEDGRLGVVIGDVTDKGVPAALVMATCRSMLRAAALRHGDPGQVLADVNVALVPEIPPAMFVTCLYAIVDTEGGAFEFANAGHNLPYVRTDDGAVELRATGMPLGLMLGMEYETVESTLNAGDVMVLTSDGITEAHDATGEMYGFGRLIAQVEASGTSTDVVSSILDDLEDWMGADAEQEDDITLVVLQCIAAAKDAADAFVRSNGRMEVLSSFAVPSEDGNERIAIDEVNKAIAGLGLEPSQIDRLGTAVGETVMNAIEHGNQGRVETPVEIEVAASTHLVTVRVTDRGGGADPAGAEAPDIEAKLSGEQTPRGWGLFLIEHMVDEIRHITDGDSNTVELFMNIKGGPE